jgi:hypothetical protein
MTLKEKATRIYEQHIALAGTDGRLFRRTVREQIMAEIGCTGAAASTYYNNCKKAHDPIDGLGRAPVPKGVRKPGKPGTKEQLQDDNECFTVIELVDDKVARCYPFLMQGDASEDFDSKIETWSNNEWVMIQGLGPNSGDEFKLETGEKIIKRYKKEEVTA